MGLVLSILRHELAICAKSGLVLSVLTHELAICAKSGLVLAIFVHCKLVKVANLRVTLLQFSAPAIAVSMLF